MSKYVGIWEFVEKCRNMGTTIRSILSKASRTIYVFLRQICAEEDDSNFSDTSSLHISDSASLWLSEEEEAIREYLPGYNEIATSRQSSFTSLEGSLADFL